MVFFILPRTRAIFQKFLGKSVQKKLELTGLAYCQEFDNIFALSCQETKKMSRKILRSCMR